MASFLKTGPEQIPIATWTHVCLIPRSGVRTNSATDEKISPILRLLFKMDQAEHIYVWMGLFNKLNPL